MKEQILTLKSLIATLFMLGSINASASFWNSGLENKDKYEILKSYTTLCLDEGRRPFSVGECTSNWWNSKSYLQRNQKAIRTSCEKIIVYSYQWSSTQENWEIHCKKRPISDLALQSFIENCLANPSESCLEKIEKMNTQIKALPETSYEWITGEEAEQCIANGK